MVKSLQNKASQFRQNRRMFNTRHIKMMKIHIQGKMTYTGQNLKTPMEMVIVRHRK